MPELPEFVTVGDKRYEVLLVRRIVEFGQEQDARVCHRTGRIYVSAAVPESDRPALLRQAGDEALAFLASRWLPV